MSILNTRKDKAPKSDDTNNAPLWDLMGTLRENPNHSPISYVLSIEELDLSIKAMLQETESWKDVENNNFSIKKAVIIHILNDFWCYSAQEDDILRSAVHNINDPSLNLLMQCRDIHRFWWGKVVSLPNMKEVHDIFFHIRQELSRWLHDEDFCKRFDNSLSRFI